MSSAEISPPNPAAAPGGRRDSGVALLASVLLLLMLASIGFASMNVVERDQQVAGYLNRKTVALMAADAGIARALEQLDATGAPALPAASLGDPDVYPQGRPSYAPDANSAAPIEDAGIGNLSGMGLQVGANAAAQFQVRFWKLRVQGEAPGGSLARVEVLTGSLIAN